MRARFPTGKLGSVLRVGLVTFVVDCNAAPRAGARDGVDKTTSASGSGRCAHAVCRDDFFIDAVAVEGCRAGEPCALAFTLVATGDYHINDEYPYKFRADDAPGVEFLGTDGASKNVFSKAAENWRKTDDKTGTMAVSFRPAEGGRKVIGGVFKLSVCSLQNCRLEVEHLNASVAVP